MKDDGVMRTFDTGATRDTADDKLDYEGFLSPLVLKRYAEYLHKHRKQSDGTMRDSDNWQKGIPIETYMKSAWRHFMEMWTTHRRQGHADEDAMCALLFNVMGYLHEVIVQRQRRSWSTGPDVEPFRLHKNPHPLEVEKHDPSNRPSTTDLLCYPNRFCN